MKKLAAIILAAGMSSRMTAFKPLLEVGGMTLVDRLISIYQQNKVDIILVTGWKNQELAATLKNNNIVIADNPDFQQGMFTSVAAGVRALGNNYSAFFIHPVDIPLVRRCTIRLLVTAHELQAERIIYPTYGGKRGHPVIVPATLSSMILADKPEVGLRDILAAYPQLALDIKTADRYILFDIDTPQDYQELLEGFTKYDIPTLEESEVILNDLGGLPQEIRKHGLKVAETAMTIARALAAKGICIDYDAVQAGALLHDLAKGQRHHDQAGGEILREMGFGRIADIVEVHTNLPPGITDGESKIVYLADKLVKGTILVNLAQRYAAVGRPFELTPEIVSRILTRRKRAEEIKQEFETILDSSLEQLFL